MQDNLKIKLCIEGYLDKRSTREYNLALGENHTLISVKQILNFGNRIKVLSYGEDKL